MITFTPFFVILNARGFARPFGPVQGHFERALEEADVSSYVFVHHPAAIRESIGGIVPSPEKPLFLGLTFVRPRVRGLSNEI